MILAPLNMFGFASRPSYHQHDTIGLWLVKWLTFRLMFASGVVKLTSGCPTWWGLTGKYWTQGGGGLLSLVVSIGHRVVQLCDRSF